MDGRKFRKISDDVFQAITSSDDEKGTEWTSQDLLDTK